MYGVTLGSSVVLCSKRAISLRKGGPLPKRTNLALYDEPLPLRDDVWKSLREATRVMGKDSTARLVSDLSSQIASDISIRQCWTSSSHDDAFARLRCQFTSATSPTVVNRVIAAFPISRRGEGS